MALNAIASDVLVKLIDGGAVDGSPTGTPLTVKALARNIEKEDGLMAEIETGGIGDATAKYRPGRSRFRFTMDLLVPKVAGATGVILGNYVLFEFATDTGLTPTTGTALVTTNGFRVVDNQETLQNVTFIGPADV